MRWRGVFPILLSFALIPTATYGACPDPPLESPLAPGEVGLFFDAGGTRSCDDPPLFVSVPVYLVGRAPAGGIGAYSIPWLAATSLPSSVVFVTNSLQLPTPSPFETGSTADWCNLAIPLQPGCAITEGELVVLGVGSIQRVAATAGTARFETQCPTFAGQRAEPVWYEACGSTEPLTLEGGGRLVLGFGESPVATSSSTWSTVKARFSDRR